MAVIRWRRRFCSNLRVGYPNLELPTPTPLDPQDIPPPPTPCPPPTLPSIHFPSWPDEPTQSLAVPGPRLSFPQENDIVVTLRQLNEAGEGFANEVLLEWALDVLRSLENWRWLWSPEPTTTPSSFLTLPNHLPPLSHDASNANPWTMYTPIAQNTSVHSADKLLLDTCSARAQCTPAQSVESLVMWAPLVQPQLQHTLHLSLPKWVTWDDLESESQGYKGGCYIFPRTLLVPLNSLVPLTPRTSLGTP